jgi:hypothetical protein
VETLWKPWMHALSGGDGCTRALSLSLAEGVDAYSLLDSLGDAFLVSKLTVGRRGLLAGVRVCVRARACVRVRVCVCESARVRACACVCVCACVKESACARASKGARATKRSTA